jgi:hypothetical protein
LFATGQLLLSVYEGTVFLAVLTSNSARKAGPRGSRLLTALRVTHLTREVFSRERIVVRFVVSCAEELSPLFFRNRFFEATF